MRYNLIIFRKNGWNYDRCRGNREDETEALCEITSSKDREEIVQAYANSLAIGGLHETGSEYEPREYHLFVNGCEFSKDWPAEEYWQYDDEDEQEAHKIGWEIYNAAHALVDKRIEEAKLEAQRKAEAEAERQKKLLREQEVNRLARLKKEHDDLAAKLGVAS